MPSVTDMLQQAVQELVGYHSTTWNTLVIIITGGLFWVFLKVAPIWATFLLTRCPLHDASFVLIKVTYRAHHFSACISNVHSSQSVVHTPHKIRQFGFEVMLLLTMTQDVQCCKLAIRTHAVHIIRAG